MHEHVSKNIKYITCLWLLSGTFLENVALSGAHVLVMPKSASKRTMQLCRCSCDCQGLTKVTEIVFERFAEFFDCLGIRVYFVFLLKLFLPLGKRRGFVFVFFFLPFKIIHLGAHFVAL